MRKHVRKLLAVTALALTFWCLAGSGDAQDGQMAVKKFLPAGAYKELLARTAKAIEAKLAAPDDEDNLRRAQAYAAMIEGYCLCAQPGAGDTAGVGGAALELAKIVTNKSKIGHAKKLAVGLAMGKGEPGAKAPENLLGKYPEDLGDLMNLLKPKAKGGEGMAPALQSNIRLKGALNGIEEKIRALAKKKLADDRLGTEAAELALLGYKMAVLAEITVRHPAPRKGNGTQKDWNQLSYQMRDTSLDLAAAASKKDAEATFNAANKLNTTCSQCHSLFR